MTKKSTNFNLPIEVPKKSYDRQFSAANKGDKVLNRYLKFNQKMVDKL